MDFLFRFDRGAFWMALPGMWRTCLNSRACMTYACARACACAYVCLHMCACAGAPMCMCICLCACMLCWCALCACDYLWINKWRTLLAWVLSPLATAVMSKSIEFDGWLSPPRKLSWVFALQLSLIFFSFYQAWSCSGAAPRLMATQMHSPAGRRCGSAWNMPGSAPRVRYCVSCVCFVAMCVLCVFFCCYVCFYWIVMRCCVYWCVRVWVRVGMCMCFFLPCIIILFSTCMYVFSLWFFFSRARTHSCTACCISSATSSWRDHSSFKIWSYQIGMLPSRLPITSWHLSSRVLQWARSGYVPCGSYAIRTRATLALDFRWMPHAPARY